MLNHKPPTRELSTGDFYKGRAEIFFMFSPFSLCGQKPGARITVFYTASLRRRRTGWSRGPASCSWRRSRSWRRRWTGTWTGSAKQVKRSSTAFLLLWDWKPLPWLLLAREWRPRWPNPHALSPISSFTSGQWWRTLALSLYLRHIISLIPFLGTAQHWPRLAPSLLPKTQYDS